MKTTMRATMILALTIAGCSGGGDSTTASMPTGDDSGSTGTPTPTTDAPTTNEPTTDTPTTDAPTTDAPTTGTGTGDTGEEPTGDTTSGACPAPTIEGVWLSEGENVAQLLVDLLSLVRIDATFEETTFTVESLDDAGAMGLQSGTYSVEPCPGSETKFSIFLDQTVPSAITAEGIFEIDTCMDPHMMRYEVIQTQPDVGVVAPTCDDDFGAGQFGADNIQIFVRQR